NLSCTSGSGTSALKIPAGASVHILVPVTPTQAGTLVNPRAGTGNVCKVDPNSRVTEGNENNNTCADTVTVTDGKANTQTSIATVSPEPSSVGQAYEVKVMVTSLSGMITPIGTVTVTDGTTTSAPCTLSGDGVNNTATASCSLASSSEGQKTLTATYAGDV